MKCSVRVFFLVVILSVFPMAAVSWQSNEHKFSFEVPNAGWKDMGADREGILKKGVVEFASTNGSNFSVSCYPYRVDEEFRLHRVHKTSETTLSMVQAYASGPVWHIGTEGIRVINGMSGYQREISYMYNGRVYSAIIIVFAKNDTHYTLLYTWPGDIYITGFRDFQSILSSFRISD